MTQKSTVLEEKACFEIPIAEGHPSPGMAIPVLMEHLICTSYNRQQTDYIYVRGWPTRIAILCGFV
jgi:hypothetical protein